MIGAVVKLNVRRVRACERFESKFSGAKFCAACGWREWLHPRRVSCSSCGEEFSARRGERAGFSHCDQHQGRIAC